MKTKNLSVVLCPLLAFAFGLPVAAQESPRPPRQRFVPPAPQAGQPGQPYQEVASAEFPHNVKLALEGSLFGTFPTDFSVTTAAPIVTTDLPMGGEGPTAVIGTFQAVLTPGAPWQVQVSLSARVPISSGNGNVVEYRDLRLNSTVRIAPGKKVVLWQKGEQKLTLSMEKVEE